MATDTSSNRQCGYNYWEGKMDIRSPKYSTVTNMPYRQTGLALLLIGTATTSAFAQIPPEFPKSEYKQGREGWVVLSYELGGDGTVVSASISDSSGNRVFDEAALEVVGNWSLGATAERDSSVLINFVFEEKKPRLSRKFMSRNKKVHKALDSSRLDLAQELVEEIRAMRRLNPFELAYSFVAEARIEEARGDKAGQLMCFRRAMLSGGRWLQDETYVKLLYATTVLGLQQKDYVSAVRDYDLLAQFESGRALASRIETPIQAARQFLATRDRNPLPYLAANQVVNVERELPRRLGDETYADAGYVFFPSADKADTPPANN